MSWSANCTVPVGSNSDKINTLIYDMEIMGGKPAEDETREQVLIAKRAAKLMLQSLCFGSNPYQIGISGYLIILAGHANPGNRPRAGWSNDSVTVTVGQVTEKSSV